MSPRSNIQHKSALQLYKAYFCEKSLISLFKDKISLSRTVGKDGIRQGVFEDRLRGEIALILKKVHNQTYVFTGYKESLISKGAGKAPRQISIPTFRDRLALRAVCEILGEIFQDAKTPPPHDLIKRVREICRDKDDDFCFLRMDIRDYYPSIRHNILMRQLGERIRVPQLLYLIEKAIQTPTGKKNCHENQVNLGVPQGLSISNILSAIYLRPIDIKFQGKYNYFRYVDDILVICLRNQAQQVYKEIYDELNAIGLECHPLSIERSGKTEITSMTAGVEYLGFKIDKYTVSVRPSSYNRMFANLLKVFTNYKYNKNKERLIFRLNLKITGCIFDGKRRGWMFFFAQTENKSQLRYLDKFVSDLLVKYHLDEEAESVKTFIKTYHEIRYNSGSTQYIENFETYTIEKKIKMISVLTGIKEVEIQTWKAERIEEKFRACAFKEIVQLEKDLIEAFS